MNKRAAVLLVCLILCTIGGKAYSASQSEFVSPWLANMKIPPLSQAMILSRVKTYESWNRNLTYRRVAHYVPYTIELRQKMDVDVWAMAGMAILESAGNPDAVDGIYGRHVGIYQLNSGKLPGWNKWDKKRQWYANRYAKTRDKSLIPSWRKYDLRLKPRYNTKAAGYYYHYNKEKTGHSTFSIAGHHAGTGDPLKGVVLDAAEHGHRLRFKDVDAYVKKKQLNYFILFERKGAAYRHWKSKGENHEQYVYNVAAWSEVFARWLKKHPDAVPEDYRCALWPGEKKQMACDTNKPKTPRVATTVKETTDGHKSKEDSEVNTAIAGMNGFVSNLWHSTVLPHLVQVGIRFLPLLKDLVPLLKELMPEIIITLAYLLRKQLWRLLVFVLTTPLRRKKRKTRRVIKAPVRRQMRDLLA